MKIDIKGVIIDNDDQWIYDWFGIEAVSPKKVLDKIAEANGKELELAINSGGGSVYAASEIYTALKEYPNTVTGKIVALAASAASAIAMGCDRLLMAPTAQMMVHNASTFASGDYREMEHKSNFLKNVNQTIATAYSLKCGKPYEELLVMMDGETWLTPQQALEHGLIDEIMFHESVSAVASDSSGLLPPEVISKVRNELKIKQVSNVSAELKKEDESHMDIEKLKNEFPDLYNTIKQEGYNEGIAAENARIKAIEDIAQPGYENLVNQAKYETKATPEQLAMNIMKAQKEQGETFLQNRQKDADLLNVVKGDAAPENNSIEVAEIKNKGNAIANVINRLRGAGN